MAASGSRGPLASSSASLSPSTSGSESPSRATSSSPSHSASKSSKRNLYLAGHSASEISIRRRKTRPSFKVVPPSKRILMAHQGAAGSSSSGSHATSSSALSTSGGSAAARVSRRRPVTPLVVAAANRQDGGGSRDGAAGGHPVLDAAAAALARGSFPDAELLLKLARALKVLSPTERLLGMYLASDHQRLEQVMSRIVENVQEQAGGAARRSSAMMQSLVHNVHDAAEGAVHKAQGAIVAAWKACHFEKLPSWMKDNEHLHFGHRPELRSFEECFKSIFRIHTETGNIWTHMLGFLAFLVVTVVFYLKPLCEGCRSDNVLLSDKLIFLCFFGGAMLCLLMSTIFHTVCCHSESVSNLFSRLDYAGIAVLIVGSSITWLYYGFYCDFYHKLIYTLVVATLGLITVIVTLTEQFNLPQYRPLRASVFVLLGLLSATPTVHYLIINGFSHAVVAKGGLMHGVIMGLLYLLGALLYALRVPERFLPGKCDIWFQSHQIFHLLVVAAAFIFYKGVLDMAKMRLIEPDCPTLTQLY